MIQGLSDTHAIIWYVWDDPRLSAVARALFEAAALEGDEIAISSISLVEVVYLEERRRIVAGTLDRIIDTLQLNEVLVEVHVDRSILPALSAIDRSAIPDMPDRIIAATALHLNVPLISRDRKIQASTVRTIW